MAGEIPRFQIKSGCSFRPVIKRSIKTSKSIVNEIVKRALKECEKRAEFNEASAVFEKEIEKQEIRESLKVLKIIIDKE